MVEWGDRSALLRVGDGRSFSSTTSSGDDSGEESGSVTVATDSSSVSQDDELTPLCHSDTRRSDLTQTGCTLMQVERAQQDTDARDCPDSRQLDPSHLHTRWKLNSSGYVELPDLTCLKELSDLSSLLLQPSLHGDARLEGRQEPDGCSMSSESVDLMPDASDGGQNLLPASSEGKALVTSTTESSQNLLTV